MLRFAILAFGKIASPSGMNIATICMEAPEIIHRATAQQTLNRALRVRVASVIITDPKIQQTNEDESDETALQGAEAFCLRLVQAT